MVTSSRATTKEVNEGVPLSNPVVCKSGFNFGSTGFQLVISSNYFRLIIDCFLRSPLLVYPCQIGMAQPTKPVS